MIRRNRKHDRTAGDGGPDGHHERTMEELAVGQDAEAWRTRSRIFLTPIAAPAIMGLFGFMIATLMLGAWQAGWYGTPATPSIIWPFALTAGGILQSIAAIAGFRARDGVATAVHTAWGSFWIGWGILQLLVVTGVMAAIPLGAVNQAFGFWFIVLAMVTAFGALGALAQNLGVLTVLSLLTIGSALTAAGFFSGSLVVTQAGGWLFVCSAVAAWLTAGAMTLEHTFGRTLLPVSPLRKLSKAVHIPTGHPNDPVSYPGGMPGVKVGQ